MKLIDTFKRKLSILTKILKIVYTVAPLFAVVRDLTFLASIAVGMYNIKVGGQFIDATANILSNWNTFSVKDYFYSDSFYFLFLGLGLMLLTMALDSLKNFIDEDINKKMVFHMQSEFFESISRANLEDVESKKFRDLLTLVPNFSYENITATYKEYSKGVGGLISALSAMVILYGTIGLPSLILFLIAIPENIVAHYGRKKRKAYNDSQVEVMKKVSYFENLMTRIPFFSELRVDGTFGYIKKTYSNDAKNNMNGWLYYLSHFYIDTTLFNILGQILLVFYIVFTLIISIAKRYTIGHFKAIYDYVKTANAGLGDFYSSTLRISTYLEYSQSYFELVEYKGFGDIEHGESTLGDKTPSLEFESLKFNYPGDTKLSLNGVNLKVLPGEKVAIIGGDGSGKSSLIKLLCGLYKIDGGKYSVNGTPIQEIQRGELKKHLSVVFQDFVNYNLSIKENIALAHLGKNLNRDLYNTVIKICEIDKLMTKENIDDDQILGKYFSKGRELSPGYWQRLAIARMLYRNRNVFIMDEPFTYIDEFSRKPILKDIIKFIGKDRSLIYIAQDDDYIDLFDKVYVLRNGKISEYKSSK